MPTLPLHVRHQQQGARFSPVHEWELPADYGDPQSEYRAVREKVGAADLSHQRPFLITGRDRVPFLQNLISNDLNKLEQGKGLYATLLTAKGRVLSDFYLYLLADALFMDVEWTNAQKTVDQLMRFKLRSQIKIESPPWGRLLVSGPQARPLLEALFGSLPIDQEKSFFQTESDGITLRCIKQSITGGEDYHLYVPLEGLEKIWERLFSAGGVFGLTPFGQSTLETLRIEAGKPRYGIDIDEHIIPIEAGLEAEAISYTKGCYPGQEVMARIQTYGHVNKQLMGLTIEGTELPKKDDKIFQGEKELGWITGATRSPLTGQVIAMGYVRPQIATPGTAVEVEIAQARKAAQVSALPFHRPG
ncbi:MAG: aminomethyl transferase family protein [Candidatus Manganitrophaceae bacterium]|nr:MAG: aminomethyl transferase family protein [Candidatus Manganitrophaceae bacterium]